MTRPTTHNDVSCPFCGLLCDDLRVAVESSDGDKNQDAVRLLGPDCARAARGFRAASSGRAAARIDGLERGYDAAIGRAAALLAAADAPLLAGMATDVNGARAALALAETLGAGVDHAGADALLANVQTLQRDGVIAATLAEVRNRADLVVVVATPSLWDDFPRLIERVLIPDQGLLPERLTRRRIVLIGPWRDPLPPALAARADVIDVELDRAAELLGALRARLDGRALNADAVAGVPIGEVDRLVTTLSAAVYTALLWPSATLPAATRDLTVGAIGALLRGLNESGRAAGLTLTGGDGAVGVNQVCTWQTGYPLRVGFVGDADARRPRFDPALYRAESRLREGHCDALLWLASFDAATAPPAGAAPTVIIGHPATAAGAAPPAVFIAAGVPGIDHAGHLYRSDGVVALPVKSLRRSALPSAARVLDDIRVRLERQR